MKRHTYIKKYKLREVAAVIKMHDFSLSSLYMYIGRLFKHISWDTLDRNSFEEKIWFKTDNNFQKQTLNVSLASLKGQQSDIGHIMPKTNDLSQDIYRYTTHIYYTYILHIYITHIYNTYIHMYISYVYTYQRSAMNPFFRYS